jgi:DNA primase
MDSALIDQAKSVNLLDFASRYTTLKRVGRSHGGEYAGPCPICGGRDRFHVQPDEGRWLCRGCTEGKWQDAIALQMRLSRQAFPQAVEALATGALLPIAPARLSAPPLCQETKGPPSEAWQARARQVITEAEAVLWSISGNRARAWLNARGLTDATLRAAHLGLISAPARETAPAWGLSGNDIYLAHGILMPCQVYGVVWYLKIRRPVGNPKYTQVRGGRSALYWAESLAGQERAVFCEGEFDALLLWQEARELAGVVTLGSAANRLDVSTWGFYLLPVPQRLLAYDVDAAGDKGAASLAWLKGARRLKVPQLKADAKDLTDCHTSGGNLRAWLERELQPASPGSGERVPADQQQAYCSEALAVAQRHPAYIPGLPICRQPLAVEEAWWAAVFAERGIPDPAPLE